MATCEFAVEGLIGDRWQLLGGAAGPMGCPLGPETDLAGASGRQQRFEGGHIAWSAGQEMVISVFRTENEACFEWAIVPGSELHYDYFRFDVLHRGDPGQQFAGHGHANLKVHNPKRGRFWVSLQDPGEYAFKVKGCDNPVIGSETSPQGWTALVTLTVLTEPSGGLIERRWRLFGGADGPLGAPVEPVSTPDGYPIQRFEHGAIAAYPQIGPDMAVVAYQAGRSVELHWGFVRGTGSGGTLVEVFKPDVAIPDNFQWVEPTQLSQFDYAFEGASTGHARLWPNRAGIDANALDSQQIYLIRLTSDNGPVVDIKFPFIHYTWNVKLDSPALDGGPEHAYASHNARVDAIARHFLRTRRLHRRDVRTGEDVTFELIAHLHALSKDPGHHAPGQLPSSVLVAICLREITLGEMGTKRDYDMALKGLMTILFRYRRLLNAAQIAFILDELVAQNFFGPHDPWAEIYVEQVGPLSFHGPETENHLLMIESCRFLINQIRFEQTGNPVYHSLDNGLTDWLLQFMHDIARHDFLEFNSRSYARLSTHALLNIFEFSGDHTLKRAAWNLLDYAAVKFAVSSSRHRHVGPFRRMKDNLNRPDEWEFNYLYSKRLHPYTGFFRMLLGPVSAAGQPELYFPDDWALEALMVGLSSYRPPAAAYILAATDYPAEQHTFYHGPRPIYAAAERADPGLEIYYRSKSFLLTAGGTFLNSGYGSDEHVEMFGSGSGVAVAQSTTLIPHRADMLWSELIRFDRYPDDTWFRRRSAVCTGVHLGFACGPNLIIPPRWFELAEAQAEGPWTILNLERLGFYLAAYRVPMGDTEYLLHQYGELPSNFGVLHVMEAHTGDDDIDFATFERLTRERNPNPPLEYDYGGTYEFHTADHRTFRFIVHPVEDRYRPRIVAVDGQALPASFTENHLAQGRYLQTPHGHDGYAEIRHPGCDYPLVLDFRNPIHAVRTDNSALCPQWGSDVGKAFLERARALFDARKYVESLAATREAVAHYRDAARLNPALSDVPLLQAANDWVARAAAAHPHDVPAQLAAAENAWEILRFLAERGGIPVRRLEVARLLYQTTSYLGFGATNTRKMVPAAELTRTLYLGLEGDDHRLEIAESYTQQAMIHHVISIHGEDIDPLAEQAEQRRTATEAAAILTPITESLPGAGLDDQYLQRMGGVWGKLVGTITFGAPESAPSAMAAGHGITVYTHLTDRDHRIDIAGLWGALALRHHEISFHPDCTDRPGEQAKQRQAAAQSMSVLVPVAETIPSPAVDEHQMRLMKDIFSRLTGLLAFGAPPSQELQQLVDQAAAWRDRLEEVLGG